MKVVPLVVPKSTKIPFFRNHQEALYDTKHDLGLIQESIVSNDWVHDAYKDRFQKLTHLHAIHYHEAISQSKPGILGNGPDVMQGRERTDALISDVKSLYWELGEHVTWTILGQARRSDRTHRTKATSAIPLPPNDVTPPHAPLIQPSIARGAIDLVSTPVPDNHWALALSIPFPQTALEARIVRCLIGTVEPRSLDERWKVTEGNANPRNVRWMFELLGSMTDAEAIPRGFSNEVLDTEWTIFHWETPEALFSFMNCWKSHRPKELRHWKLVPFGPLDASQRLIAGGVISCKITHSDTDQCSIKSSDSNSDTSSIRFNHSLLGMPVHELAINANILIGEAVGYASPRYVERLDLSDEELSSSTSLSPVTSPSVLEKRSTHAFTA